MDSPYPLKEIDHLSASALSDYAGNCEAKSALARNCIGVPAVAIPAAAVYGTAIHYLCDSFCKHWWRIIRQTGKPLDLPEAGRLIRYGLKFVKDSLSEQGHSARGQNLPPEPIRWMTYAAKAALPPAQYREQVEEAIKQYLGRAYNALTAVALEYTVPLPFSHMIFEYNFNGLKIMVGKPGTPWRVRLEGAIDRIRYSPDGYDVTDYKTGYVINEYQKRKKLAEDIQMTVYNLVMLTKEGKPPREIFIQPLEVKKDFREKHQALTLARLRKPVPVRREIHFRELNLLASDVLRMIHYVVNAGSYTVREREAWRPESAEAEKLGLHENVAQGRFIPRIGSWCSAACQYYELCLRIYAEDWAEYRSRYEQDPEEGVQQPLPIPRQQEQRESQGTLFEREARRSPYVSKKNRILKREMVASGQFYPKTRLRGIETPSVRGSITQDIQQMLLADGMCPCTRFQLTPRWALENLGLLAGGSLSVKDLAQYCPCEHCPRRNNNNNPSGL